MKLDDVISRLMGARSINGNIEVMIVDGGRVFELYDYNINVRSRIPEKDRLVLVLGDD